jgi:hypothetical protein
VFVIVRALACIQPKDFNTLEARMKHAWFSYGFMATVALLFFFVFVLLLLLSLRHRPRVFP